MCMSRRDEGLSTTAARPRDPPRFGVRAADFRPLQALSKLCRAQSSRLKTRATRGPQALENTMTTRKIFAPLMGGAAAIAAVVGMTAGLALAAAAPAQSGATLYVYEDPKNADNYRVSIKGVFPMQQPDAVGFLVHVNDGN